MNSNIIQYQPSGQLAEILALIQKPAPIQIVEKKSQNNQDQVLYTEIPNKLEQFTNEANHYFKQQNIKEFFLSLKKSEHLITSFNDVNIDYVICNFINLGLFYNKIGLLEESYDILQILTQYVCKNKNYFSQINDKLLQKSQNIQTFTQKMKLLNILYRVNIQMCITLSEMDKHEEAFHCSQEAIKLQISIFLNQIQVCYCMINKCKSDKNKKTQIILNLRENQDVLQRIYKILAILLDIFSKLKEFHNFQEQKSYPVLQELQKIYYNVCNEPADISFILNNMSDKGKFQLKYNILNLLQITYQDINDVRKSYQLIDLIHEDKIFLTIANISAAFYCSSIEARFVQEQSIGKQKFQNVSESMLTKSLCIAYTYLPHSITFVSQIISVFKKAYALNQQSIPETDENEKQSQQKILFLKPILGIQRTDQFIPLIRFPKGMAQIKLVNNDKQITQTDRIGKKITKQMNQRIKNIQLDNIYQSYSSSKNLSPAQYMEKSKSQDILKNFSVPQSPSKKSEINSPKSTKSQVFQINNDLSFKNQQTTPDKSPRMVDKIKYFKQEVDQVQVPSNKAQQTKGNNIIKQLNKIYQGPMNLKRQDSIKSSDKFSEKNSDKQSQAATEGKKQRKQNQEKPPQKVYTYKQSGDSFLIQNNINIIINNDNQAQTKQIVKDVLNNFEFGIKKSK